MEVFDVCCRVEGYNGIDNENESPMRAGMRERGECIVSSLGNAHTVVMGKGGFGDLFNLVTICAGARKRRPSYPITPRAEICTSTQISRVEPTRAFLKVKITEMVQLLDLPCERIPLFDLSFSEGCHRFKTSDDP